MKSLALVVAVRSYVNISGNHYLDDITLTVAMMSKAFTVTDWLAVGWVNRSAHGRSKQAGLIYIDWQIDQGGLVAAINDASQLGYFETP
jgi:hypothetical protein